MIDSKAKRAAAIGFGLASLLVLPPASGAITIEGAGHALSAYQFDLFDTVPAPEIDGDEVTTANAYFRRTIAAEVSYFRRDVTTADTER